MEFRRTNKIRKIVTNYSFLFLFSCLLFIPTHAASKQTEVIAREPALLKESTTDWEYLLLEVQLNNTVLSEVIQCYQDTDKRIWVKEKDLRTWRLHLPNHSPRRINQKTWYLLDAYSSLHYQIDWSAMRLDVQAPPNLFMNQSFVNEVARVGALRPSVPGLFINYDLVAARNEVTRDVQYTFAQTRASALVNVGFFNRFGVGTADFLAYNRMLTHVSDIQTAPNKLLRLNTTWTLDLPERIASLRFGDSITGSTYWSGAARFTGIQYATNFNTQPNLITFPLPSYRGEAALPSTVDVLVNRTLNQKKSVETGPYSIHDIPVVSGAGEVKVVTKDILGRTQAISFPYYVTPRLLKPNLANFSYEIGFLRKNYGVNSNHYGQVLGVLTYERGITRHLTLGSHAELLTNQQSLGLSGNYLVNNYGVLSFAVAGGHSEFGGGGLVALGFSRQGSELSYGFNSVLTSSHYLRIGERLYNFSRPSFTNQFFVGYNLKNYGSLSLGYTMVNNRSNLQSDDIMGIPSSRLVTGTYSRSLFRNISLGLGFVGDFYHHDANQAFISLIFAPENAPIINSYTNTYNGQVDTALQLNKPIPLGVGYGYNLFASNQDTRYAGADVTFRNNYGAYAAAVAKGNGSTNYELDASGSLIYFAGDVFFGRKLMNSFALVQVPSYKNVEVLYQHQSMGRTNAKGNLLIPDLLPYQKNHIEIDPISLPMNTLIHATKKIVVPYFYSGALVKFNVHSLQGLIIHLKKSNGQFIPAGSEVRLQEDLHQEVYIVGHDGTLYLPDITSQRIYGRVQTKEGACMFEAMIPKTMDPILELGEIVCHI